MQYKLDDNRIWEDTGRIKVHNYPTSSPSTYSYITKVYKEYKKEQLGYKEVEGEPIYFHEMKPEEISLAIILVYAENALNNLCKFDTFLTPIKNKK